MGGLPILMQHLPGAGLRPPWIELGGWPTPVERLTALGRQFGGELWIKRDDLSGAIYGGNKVRKLELLLGQALARGARSVATVGGVGSSHMIATGLYGRQLGLEVSAVVVPQPVTPAVRASVALARSLGVELHPCPTRALVPLYLARARRDAPQPCYEIGPGGSSPLGTVGYVAAALELRAQIDAGLLPAPDVIYVALGSGGTLAGLCLGCALGGIEARLVGVRVVERALCNASLVRVLMLRTVALLRGFGLRLPWRPPRFEVRHGQLGGRYGQPTAAAERTLRLAREAEGLELETTYTAKALAALLEDRPAGTVLFWNTYNSRDTSGLLVPGVMDDIPARVRGWLER